jgi:hypothetical protein
MTVALPADVYYALHQLRLARGRGDSAKLPPLGELVREALEAYVREASEPFDKTEAHDAATAGSVLKITTNATR